MDERGGGGGENQRDGQVEETAGDEPGAGHGQVHGPGEGVAGVRIHAVQRGGERRPPGVRNQIGKENVC